MHKHFLCPKHREWLYHNSMAANHHLADSQETGQFYRERGRWLEALPYLGCAYETAELILATLARDKKTAVITFTSCAILLADTFHKAAMEDNSSEIYHLAQQRLQAEFPLSYQNSTLQACIRDCIKSLHKGATTQQYKTSINSRQESMLLLH